MSPVLCRGFLSAVVGCALHVGTSAQPNHLVISQIYGGGGASGATYRNDFIEIYNPTGSTVSVNGWSVQYAPVVSSLYTATTLSGSIAPYSFFLVQCASSGSDGVLLPTADATSIINLNESNGNVLLRNTTGAFVTACPISSTIVDRVGYGTGSACQEGGTRAPVGSVVLSVQRNNGGCIDSEENGSDFTAATPAPRNSASPALRAPYIVGYGGMEMACSYWPVNLLVQAGGTEPLTYQWTGAGDISGGDTPSMTVMNASTGDYTATVSNTCGSAQQVLPLLVDQALDPGHDSSVVLCAAGNLIALFPLLGGDPDQGGSWSFNGTPHGGHLLPGVDLSGAYVYTVPGNGLCGERSAQVFVTFHAPQFAGIDLSVPSCTTAPSFNMSQLVFADFGGTWTFNGMPHGLFFTPALDQGGVYTYTIGEFNVCGPDTAFLTISNPQGPNASINYGGNIYLCASTNPTPQVNLTGTTGGLFSGDPGLQVDAITGQINTAISTTGLHMVTYSIPATPGCPAFSTSTQVNLVSPFAQIAPSQPYYFCGTNNSYVPMQITITGGTGGYSALTLSNGETFPSVQAITMVYAHVLSTGPVTLTSVVDNTTGCAAAPGAMLGGAYATIEPTQNWYIDNDGDGFGDMNSVAYTECSAPAPGFVTNNTDDCPWVPGKIGWPCDDNNPNTTGDVLNANCQCVGTCSPPVIYDTVNPVQTRCASDSIGLYASASGQGPFSYTTTGPSPVVPHPSVEGAFYIVGDVSGMYSIIVSNACGSDTAYMDLTVLPVPSVSTVVTSSCGNNGAIDLTASGPAGPYQYIWLNGECSGGCPAAFPICQFGFCTTDSPDLSGLAPGDYIYAVTVGNGCYANAVVNVPTNTTDSDGDGIIDCTDSCPNLTGQIGSPCNDGNAGTINDVLVSGCLCAGTPINACTQDLVLEFQTDANPGQISWEIRAQGTNALVQVGTAGSIVAPNGTQSIATCVPDGCYTLRVLDAGGDGITGGGYVLRLASGKRIIDDRYNFFSGGVSQIAGNQGWCVSSGAIGNDRLLTTSCDRMDLQRGATAACSEKLTADNTPNNTSGNVYQFWVYNPNGPESQLIPATGAGSNILSMNQITLPAGKLYNVKVRTRISTNVYRDWGPACRMSISTGLACRTTKLVDDVSSASWSCGKTVTLPAVGGGNGAPNMLVAKPATRLNANCVEVGANKYQFRIKDVDTQVSTVVNGSGSNYYCYMTRPTFGPCRQYEVDVRASFDNGATWCTYSDVCTVYTGGCLWSGAEHMATQSGTVQVYPNPNRGDRMNLVLDGVDARVHTATVEIHDGFGKRVLTRTIAVNDGLLNSTLDLDGSLSAGLYIVSIGLGDSVLTQRLVVQP